MHLTVVSSVLRRLSSLADCQSKGFLGSVCFTKLKVAFYALIEGAGGIQTMLMDSDGFPFKSALSVQLIGGQAQDHVTLTLCANHTKLESCHFCNVQYVE